MAGYLFVLDRSTSPSEQLSKGVFFPWVPPIKGAGSIPVVAKIAGDLVSMRPDDSVYFFGKRGILGRGRICPAPSDSSRAWVFDNFPGASEMKPGKPRNLVIRPPKGVSPERVRWGFCFAPQPLLADPVDMDLALQSNPSAFRRIRFFEGRTFVHVDRTEELALLQAILRRNWDAQSQTPRLSTRPDEHSDAHGKVRESSPELIDISKAGAALAAKQATLPEALIEAMLVQSIAQHDGGVSTLGQWDFVTRQVPASPFKPTQYVDWIDVLASRGFRRFEPGLTSGFLVGEVKLGSAAPKDVRQLMKYVDWICEDRAGGDYRLVTAALIAQEFTHRCKAECRKQMTRYSVFRDGASMVSEPWTGLQLVSYGLSGGRLALKSEWPEPAHVRGSS